MNKVLSIQEIQSFIECPPTGNENGLIGYWDFKESSQDGQVLDLSPNGNNGTINGATYSDDVPEQSCEIASCSSFDEINVTFGICP